MRTNLTGEQKYRLFKWLEGHTPDEVWRRAAADLAALDFVVTESIVRSARPVVAPKPPKERSVRERVADLEVHYAALRGFLAAFEETFTALQLGDRLPALEARVELLGDGLKELSAAPAPVAEPVDAEHQAWLIQQEEQQQAMRQRLGDLEFRLRDHEQLSPLEQVAARE